MSSPTPATELDPSPAGEGLLSSVRRALRVLEVVASAGDGIPAKAVARRCGFKLSTTYHLLNTLVHDGYLVRLPHARGYGLGYKVGDLNRSLLGQLPAPARVPQALEHAHRFAGAPTYFAVLRDAHLVVTDIVDSPEAPRARPLDVGFHEGAHATAFGKVLLAHVEPRVRREFLAETRMPRVTRRTNTRIGAFEEELGDVRAFGLAQDSEEFMPGLACVAVPVRDVTGQVVGALAASAPADRFAERRGLMTAGVLQGAALLADAPAPGRARPVLASLFPEGRREAGPGGRRGPDPGPGQAGWRGTGVGEVPYGRG
jgi:DNA-binding IclR family transcriptional regulator